MYIIYIYCYELTAPPGTTLLHVLSYTVYSVQCVHMMYVLYVQYVYINI